jgi:hypothetical protein
MLKAKHLYEISNLYDDVSNASKIEKMILEAANRGEYEIEIDSKLLDCSKGIREKLTKKGFTLFYGTVTTCVSWRNI